MVASIVSAGTVLLKTKLTLFLCLMLVSRMFRTPRWLSTSHWLRMRMLLWLPGQPHHGHCRATWPCVWTQNYFMSRSKVSKEHSTRRVLQPGTLQGLLFLQVIAVMHLVPYNQWFYTFLTQPITKCYSKEEQVMERYEENERKYYDKKPHCNCKNVNEECSRK